MPQEWRSGMASSGHRLGAPPLRRRGQDQGIAGPRAEQRLQRRMDDAGEGEQDSDNWNHQAFAMSQNMWFGISEEGQGGSDDRYGGNAGVAPLVRYKPASRGSQEVQRPAPAGRAAAASSSSSSSMALAPKTAPAPPRKPVSRGMGILPLARGPTTGAAGSGWGREEDWSDSAAWEWEQEPRKPAASSRPAAEKAKAPCSVPRICPGSVVRSMFQDSDWYLATVEQDNGDGTFTIAWLDGDPSDRVKRREDLKLVRYCKDTQSYTEVLEEVSSGEPHPDPLRAGEQEQSEGAPEEAAPASVEVEPSLEGEVLPLEVGDRIRVVGLKTRPEMNGILGTLIEQREEERWQVAMDSDMGVKIFKTKNLERLPMDDFPEEVD